MYEYNLCHSQFLFCFIFHHFDSVCVYVVLDLCALMVWMRFSFKAKKIKNLYKSYYISVWWLVRFGCARYDDVLCVPYMYIISFFLFTHVWYENCTHHDVVRTVFISVNSICVRMLSVDCSRYIRNATNGNTVSCLLIVLLTHLLLLSPPCALLRSFSD